ncbi:MAG TPA: hypothetical protein VFR88_07460 [Microlunatus sp.]|nr:hypothetical protein [Microlunatus sp.]
MSTPVTGRDQRPSMRFAVDSWDPGYGTSFGIDGREETVTSVVTDVEVAADDWAPIAVVPVEPPRATIFVDGVRRIDARIWIDAGPPAGSGGPATEASMGLCASYAAGAICCCDRGAHVLRPEIRRGLFTVDAAASGLETWAGSYPVNPAVLNENQGLALSLSTALQQRLTELELIAAVNARSHAPEHGTPDGSELLVVDGPVRGREHLPRVLGFIKSHQIAYLEPGLHGMVATLAPHQRTPVFLIGGSWDRFSWYLRLPGPPSHPWSGIARLECAANVTAPEVIALAHLSQAVLPRFASEEFKDPRAPQNLYPVGALEKELRRRLGHPGLVYRALRQAAHTRT